MTGFFFALALAAYFLASLAYILHFSYRRGYLSWVATGLVALGFASHSVALGLRIAHLTTLPVTGLYDFFSVFAWVVILAYGVAQITLGIQQLGLFVVPISFGALGPALSWEARPCPSQVSFRVSGSLSISRWPSWGGPSLSSSSVWASCTSSRSVR